MIEPVADLRSSAIQGDRLPEKAPHLGLRLVQIDADIAEKITAFLEILAQPCPESGSLPPYRRQSQDRPDAQIMVARLER
ncbi:hypothetical protein IVB18_39075 [Bradyrhizobium sp. 186]|uniref:hypothetical protein n=1 Tax=Bradyrhizobium sp. 186 TaxID=2782654 RepID=UPI002000F2AF|nr:hypothetical protein [Bradyrhizobium sp. 186]UPK34100.1 hypothetical protein IVB18_39075 [Bradyrhizobium sp. 186]